MSKTLNELNNDAAHIFYEKSFFNEWKNRQGSIELIISPKCNLACKYCYVKDFYHQTFSEEIFNTEKTLKNLQLILDWLTENDYVPQILDIFSGELLAQKIGYDVLDIIYEHYKKLPKNKRVQIISIPTNFTFLCSQEYTSKIETLIKEFEDINIILSLSASFDGYYMEVNRPFVKDLDIPLNVLRDEKYYLKVAEFCKKYQFGFHPMIYAENIQYWKQNFDWFMKLIEAYDLPLSALYLLEVRNSNWNEESLKEYVKLLEHIFYWAWDHCEHNKKKFLDFIFENDENNPLGWNILSGDFITRGNGLSCNIQSNLTVRVADLKIFPCHRTMYEEFELGNFIVENNKIIDYKISHAELSMVIPMMKSNIAPGCADCPISELCIGGCLGAQYENTKDLFTPIPTVCNLSFTKINTLVNLLKQVGMLDNVLNLVNKKKRQQILNIVNLQEKKE